jgi:aspartyl/asparaginyl beta-hydroxylase (cupin superfamily)
MTAPLGPRVEALLSRAAAAEGAGQVEAARSLLLEAAKLASGHPVVENALGVAAHRAGDLASAERHYRAATQGDPSAPQLWVNLATVQRERGDFKGERAALEAALSRDQRHLVANLRLAERLEADGDVSGAAQRWHALLQLAQGLAEIPPGLAPFLEHARDFVGRQGDAFAAYLEAQLADARAPLTPAERRRFDACLDVVLGRRRIFTNECSGIHFPFLPADEFFDRGHFPWLEQLEAATPVIRAELQALLAAGAEGLEPYVQRPPGSPDSKWSPLDGRLDWGAFFLWKFGNRIDEACARCPETARIAQSLPLADMPGRAPTVFFSLLRPRTRLPAHTGVSNLRAIVHLPLIVPEGCGFRVGGETRRWEEGRAFAFDDTIDHEAWNDSDALRAILILDTWNPHLTDTERDLMRRFFVAADASPLGPTTAMAVAD